MEVPSVPAAPGQLQLLVLHQVQLLLVLVLLLLLVLLPAASRGSMKQRQVKMQLTAAWCERGSSTQTRMSNAEVMP